jgi:hypothetical protein
MVRRLDPISENRPEPAEPKAVTTAQRWWAAAPRICEVLFVNAVPICGLLFKCWSLATTLFLYWLENLLNTFFVGARIWLHRRLTHKRGHWMEVRMVEVKAANLTVPTTLFTNFVGSNLIFALVHGIFVALFVFGYVWQRPSLSNLGHGVLWLVTAMTTYFLLDARTLRPVVTDDRDLSAARQRADEEVLQVPPA